MQHVSIEETVHPRDPGPPLALALRETKLMGDLIVYGIS